MNKLSVLEKHIYVKQGLQRQGAQKKDKQLPQAIDIALNKAQSRIIKDRLFPDPDGVPFKFQINQKHVSDIQSIIIFNKQLTVFKDGNKSYGVLPYDFSYLVSDTSNVIEDCKDEFANSSETKTERIFIVPFVSAKTPPAPYYTNVKVKVLAVERSLTFTGYQTKEENVSIISNIINEYRILGVDAYWEEYKDVYKPNCFLISSLDINKTVNLNIDNVGYQNILYEDKAVDTFKSTLATVNEVLNRDVKADFLLSANQSFYNKSIPISPLASVQNDRILVLGTERFLVNQIAINYIRTPRKISLALNQSSELNGSVHEEICDLAIQLLKKQIEDESYVKEVQDNKGRIE
jgi:hypothetical protein